MDCFYHTISLSLSLFIDKLVASIEAELKKLQRRKFISTEEVMPRSPQSAMMCSPSVSSPACSSNSSKRAAIVHVETCDHGLSEDVERERRAAERRNMTSY